MVCRIMWIGLLEEVKCFFVFESFNYRKNIFQISGRWKYVSYATAEQSKFRAFEKLSLMILVVLGLPML